MKIDQVRKDFSILADNKWIYFDNACQSLRPKSVIDAITEYYQEYPACSGRSMHSLATKVSQKCDEARTIISKFIGAKRKEEIIFTRNTTEGINLIANSLELRKGDVVITTDKEHNSNLIPWQMLVKKKGIIHKIIPSNPDNTFNLNAYENEMNGEVKLVSMGFTSNLDGVTIPAKEVIKIAHKYKSLVLLDAAQTVPHQRINVTDLDVDFLAFSGHKMLGPSGMGVFYGKYKLLEKLSPFMVGGDTVSSSTYTSNEFLPPPEKFEAGLQDYAGIIGLGEAVKYLSKIGFSEIEKVERKLNVYVSQELLKIPNLKIVGPQDPDLRGGIISFYIEGVDHHQVAIILNQSANIMVRSGQHCVHSWFNDRQIKGSLRVSLYFYNTLEEAELFVKSLKQVLQVLS
ncbi:cysteine desulfurase [Patescibacteria group bacterium]|nr:cysteine desulfurase [Patescibacteria group bacterium]